MTNQIILYAEDDENDAFFLQRAFQQAEIQQRLVIVEDGKAVLEYLEGKGRYQDRTEYPLPGLVFLDLNMPGLSGIEVLKWIRSTPSVCTVPVVVLSSSNQDRDIHRAYAQGANGYLVKPGKLEEFAVMAKSIKDYWLTQNRASSGEP